MLSELLQKKLKPIEALAIPLQFTNENYTFSKEFLIDVEPLSKSDKQSFLNSLTNPKEIINCDEKVLYFSFIVTIDLCNDSSHTQK